MRTLQWLLMKNSGGEVSVGVANFVSLAGQGCALVFEVLYRSYVIAMVVVL